MSSLARARATKDAALTLLGALFSWVPLLPNLLRAACTGRRDRARTLETLQGTLDTLPVDAPDTPSRPLRVFLIAGEASGDEHAADLARALRSLRPDVQLEGLGGPCMAAAGVDLMADLVSHAVMGILPVLKHVPQLFGIYRRVLIRWEEAPPDVIVGIDYPGLNLRLGREARARGLRFVEYVAPQVWAWAPWRTRGLAAATDKVLAILPFEQRVFAADGVDVAYVGHPLFHRAVSHPLSVSHRAGLREGMGDGPLIALLPGSRRTEVRRILPLQLAVARIVTEKHPRARFVIPLASERLRTLLVSLIETHQGSGPHLDVRVIEPEHGHDALAAADAALTKSGTSTLNLVAHGTPAVVMYYSTFLGRLFLRYLMVAPFFALPNLLAGEEVLPEVIAEPGDVPQLAEHLLSMLPGGPRRERTLGAMARIRKSLARPGVPERAAGWVLHVAGEGAR